MTSSFTIQPPPLTHLLATHRPPSPTSPLRLLRPRAPMYVLPSSVPTGLPFRSGAVVVAADAPTGETRLIGAPKPRG
jgi:hypothetical protein